jgi:ribosome-binding protein aMBF1 (putative translation factor)
MKKAKGVSLETILERQLKDDEVRIGFEERRFYLQVARIVADLRAKAGLSQTELAKAAKVSQPLIARLEKGDQRRTPTFDMVSKILKALGYRLEIRIQPEKSRRAA